MIKHPLSRTELLIGREAVECLKNKKVVVFGAGGVGSFSIEALTRSGVGKIVIVDNDTVCITNLNRQIHANMNTVDRPKVEVMKERILDINPNCEVTALQTFVTPDNIGDIITEDVDYVIDAIDTVSSKIGLAVWCEENNVKLISSMGTGNKLDPMQFKVTDIYKTKVCPLAKVMRHELKKRGVSKLKVIYSEEIPRKPIVPQDVDTTDKCEPTKEDSDKIVITKRQTPASIAFVPSVAGMILAGEVIKDLIKEFL